MIGSPAKPGVTLRQGELDELEREEFFRLKKVQNKKKRDENLRQDAALAKARAVALDPAQSDLSCRGCDKCVCTLCICTERAPVCV